MVVFFLAVLLMYALGMLALARSWKPEGVSQADSSSSKAIIIPFRNETIHLPALLEDIYRQAADEVIWVDDHSADGGGEMVRRFILERRLAHWRIYENEGRGKKSAVTLGVQMANTDIIFVTDADCRLPKGWLAKLGTAFGDPGIQMVAGPVMTQKEGGILGAFQQVEWCSLILATHYFFSKGRSLMCSAANMAYRKEAFEKVEGFRGNEHCQSGDDEFLLKKISNAFGPSAIKYLVFKDVLVTTAPAQSWGAYLDQRARWASKWKLHGQNYHALAAILLPMIALAFLATFPWLMFNFQETKIFFVIWVLKVAVDWWTLKRILRYYAPPAPFASLAMASLIHPVYVVLVVWRSLFTTLYWKGRPVFSTSRNETEHVRR